MTSNKKSLDESTNASEDSSITVTFVVSPYVARQLHQLANPRQLALHDIARELVIASLAAPSTTDIIAYLQRSQDLTRVHKFAVENQLHDLKNALANGILALLCFAGGRDVEGATAWIQEHLFASGRWARSAPPAAATADKPTIADPQAAPNPLYDYMEPQSPLVGSAENLGAEEIPDDASTINRPVTEDSAQAKLDPLALREKQIEILVSVLQMAGHLELPFHDLLELAKVRFGKSLN